jgi:hypothetical protein
MSISAFAKGSLGSFLFGGRRGKEKSLTTRQYARLVSTWTAMIGLDASLFGTHSLRRTKARWGAGQNPYKNALYSGNTMRALAHRFAGIAAVTSRQDLRRSKAKRRSWDIPAPGSKPS